MVGALSRIADTGTFVRSVKETTKHSIVEHTRPPGQLNHQKQAGKTAREGARPGPREYMQLITMYVSGLPIVVLCFRNMRLPISLI